MPNDPPIQKLPAKTRSQAAKSTLRTPKKVEKKQYVYNSSTDSMEDVEEVEMEDQKSEDKESRISEYAKFDNMIPTEEAKKKIPTCIIYSSSSKKITWDLFVAVLLIIVCLVVPYRITFVPVEDPNVEMAFLIFDAFFFIDMCLSFFTTFPDEEEQTEITDRKAIAWDYLTTWFFIDFVSVLPISNIM